MSSSNMNEYPYHLPSDLWEPPDGKWNTHWRQRDWREIQPIIKVNLKAVYGKEWKEETIDHWSYEVAIRARASEAGLVSAQENQRTKPEDIGVQ